MHSSNKTKQVVTAFVLCIKAMFEEIERKKVRID